MKTCVKCKIEQDTSCFGPHNKFKDGLTNICKICDNNRSTKYYQQNPNPTRFITRHGLTVAQYEKMLENQGGGCAICGSSVNLKIDHDHSCCAGSQSCGNCVRGILCHSHNTALGMFKDNPELLKIAIEYITK